MILSKARQRHQIVSGLNARPWVCRVFVERCLRWRADLSETRCHSHISEAVRKSDNFIEGICNGPLLGSPLTQKCTQ